MGRVTTIDDVARRAGVSTATVSRVLNQPELVASGTRKKVHKAIDELGFRPNPHARGLSGVSRKRVGVFFLEDFAELAHNPFWALATNAVYAGLAEKDLDCQILVYPAAQPLAREINQPEGLARFLREQHVDGFVTIGRINDSVREGLTKSEMPAIIWGPHRRSGDSVPTVDSNQQGGAAQAVEHLVSRGHRKIGHIAGPHAFTSGEQRLEGFIATVQALGLELDPNWIVRGDATFESGVALTRDLLALENAPDAVFCMNDEIAFGAISFAEQNAISVPEELAIVGFDNVSSESTILRRHPTSVSQSYREIGETLAEGISALIAGRNFSSRLIDTHLYLGDTT